MPAKRGRTISSFGQLFGTISGSTPTTAVPVFYGTIQLVEVAVGNVKLVEQATGNVVLVETPTGSVILDLSP